MALRPTGVIFKLQGLAMFLAGMAVANKSLVGFSERMDRMRTTSFGRGGKSPLENLVPKQVLGRLKQLVPEIDRVSSSVQKMRTSTLGANSVWTQLGVQMRRAQATGPPTLNIYGALEQVMRNQASTMRTMPSLWASLDQQMSGNIQTTQGVNSIWTTLDSTMGGVAKKISWLKVGIGTAIFALSVFGPRGAAMRGIIEAFDTLSRYAGTTAEVFRDDLRQACRGTIKDLDLMTTANLALAGTEPEVAKALGQGGLAGLLEIARAQARATGRSVNYLYESLVLGVRRTSPRLVDNTGLIIGQTAAYEEYAAKVGKAANELSEVEKQLAILELTLKRGKVAVETYGQSALTAAERYQRISVQWENAMDRMAVAVQPLYEAVLLLIEDLLKLITGPITALAPLVYELAKAISGPLMKAWEDLTSSLSDLFAPVAEQVRRWIIVLILWVRAFGVAWDWLLRQLKKILKKFKPILEKYLVEPIASVLDPTRFAKLAGKAFGALAISILHIFNYMIAPIIIMIAQFIADFLCGESPPPKGPLSTIDQGGYKTMLAWLEGFLGVSLTPVEEMAGRVDAILGGIGKLTHEQVEERLAHLDELLEPFIANLDIARAMMERITEPLRAVQDILERKLDRALAKFFKGEWTAEAVREIDRQMEGIEERVEKAKEITDEAEIQLALAKAQQAVQRALLEIQLRRTEAAEKEKEAKEKKGKAGKEEEEVIGEVGVELPELGEDAIEDFLGITEEEIKGMATEMGIAFLEGVNLKEFSLEMEMAKRQTALMKHEFDRIKSADPFHSLTANIEWVFGTTGIIRTVEWFADAFDKIFSQDLPATLEAFTLAPLLLTWAAFELPSGILWTLPLGFYNALKGLITANLRQIFIDFTLAEFISKWGAAFLLGGEGELWNITLGWYDSVALMFNVLLPAMFTAFSLEDLYQTFWVMFGSPTDGLRFLLSTFLAFIEQIFKPGGDFATAVGEFGTVLSAVMGAPLATQLNYMITCIEWTMNEIIHMINDLLGYWFMEAALMLGIPLPQSIPDITLPRLNEPKGREGGLFGPGWMKLHADELIYSGASRLSVFPQSLSRAMTTFFESVNRYKPESATRYVYAGGGGSVDNSRSYDQRQSTYNFNVRGSQSMRLALAQAKAYG